jgi:death-on-curing protein
MTGGGGHSFFLSPVDKAAALADSIIRRQPFVDGNKRAAAYGAARMLSLFGLGLLADPAELRDSIVRLDRGETDEDGFGEWLEAHSEPLAPPEEREGSPTEQLGP